MTVALPLKARLLRPLARVVLAAERLWRGLWPAQVFVGFYLAIVGFGLLSDAGWIVRQPFEEPHRVRAGIGERVVDVEPTRRGPRIGTASEN